MPLISIIKLEAMTAIVRITKFGFCLQNNKKINPDKKKHIAALTLMGIHEGAMVIKIGILYTHPANTTKLVMIEIIPTSPIEK